MGDIWQFSFRGMRYGFVNRILGPTPFYCFIACVHGSTNCTNGITISFKVLPIVQGSTNGTIGNTIGTNGTIGKDRL